MGKINKAKARRLAKEQLRAKYGTKPGQVLIPKPSASTNMVEVLRPAFAVRNERTEALTTMALALTRLRLGVGDEEDLGLIYARVMFGRRIADAYFDGNLAEVLHHALQSIVLMCNAVGDVTSEKVTNLRLSQEDAEELSEALHLIEDMASKISPEQYLSQALRQRASPLVDPALQLQDWESAREDEAFLASVQQ